MTPHYDLALPRAVIEAVLSGRVGRERLWSGPAGISDQGDTVEWLAPRLTAWGMADAEGPLVLARVTPDLPDPADWVGVLAQAGLEAAVTVVGLGLTPAGAASAWVRTAGDWQPVRRLRLVGRGMHCLSLTEPAEVAPDPADSDRWSRVIGALSLPVWQRLRGLHYAVIGVGRAGSLLATSLARLGARRLTLIDPDRVEPHNLDAMDGVYPADVGRFKVEVVAEHLRRIGGPALIVTPLPHGLTTPPALSAVRAAEVFLCAVDDERTRLAAGILATLYLRPLLDIGGGVLRDDAGQLVPGGDIRLILPDEGRCLWCFGGLSQAARSPALLRTSEPPAPWQQLRAGSLRSVNQINAHVGLRLLEAMVAESGGSVWLRLEEAEGIPQLVNQTPPPAFQCPLCAKELGRGDAGLGRLLALAEGLLGGTL
ncbi:MAG TPA: ThiF family adenylyltransferase [Candidatus Competibacter sp.]|nr:ThiF family adenylyltransferase [Candidatus Competibacteraceae bacterium]HPE70935.1 ThiF family adenylyltransferase [Candidatus Competibacter sp.]HRW64463.1 ThiF family adenylyltransferase [Candidatus Competibacter sp.]